MISRIPAHELHDELVVTNYQPDRAIREAVLAQPEDWRLEANGAAYIASNQLLVYLGDQRNPLPVEEALSTIREFSVLDHFDLRSALDSSHSFKSSVLPKPRPRSRDQEVRRAARALWEWIRSVWNEHES